MTTRCAIKPQPCTKCTHAAPWVRERGYPVVRCCNPDAQNYRQIRTRYETCERYRAGGPSQSVKQLVVRETA